MKEEDVIKFLKIHQPMPNDDELTEEVIDQYDSAIKFLKNYPILKCLPLILNSFGEYDGFGVYQTVEDVIVKFPYEDVVKYLKEALSSNYSGVKYWCAQIATLFPDRRLASSLSKLLDDSNSDIRMAAAVALLSIGGDDITRLLEEQLVKEDEINKEFLLNIMIDNQN